jgi:prepilin-type N-terminal cleavage/methylation domain-containing protein
MRNLRRGFTLLELMIAITLMLIIMLMLRSMFVNAQTTWT